MSDSLSIAAKSGASEAEGFIGDFVDTVSEAEGRVQTLIDEGSVDSAGDALKLQFEFIKYTSQITAASQMIKTVGDAMNATVRNIG